VTGCPSRAGGDRQERRSASPVLPSSRSPGLSPCPPAFSRSLRLPRAPRLVRSCAAAGGWGWGCFGKARSGG
jgi:hypothetical protein